MSPGLNFEELAQAFLEGDLLDHLTIVDLCNLRACNRLLRQLVTGNFPSSLTYSLHRDAEPVGRSQLFEYSEGRRRWIPDRRQLQGEAVEGLLVLAGNVRHLSALPSAIPFLAAFSRLQSHSISALPLSVADAPAAQTPNYPAAIIDLSPLSVLTQLSSLCTMHRYKWLPGDYGKV